MWACLCLCVYFGGVTCSISATWLTPSDAYRFLWLVSGAAGTKLPGGLIDRCFSLIAGPPPPRMRGSGEWDRRIRLVPPAPVTSAGIGPGETCFPIPVATDSPELLASSDDMCEKTVSDSEEGQDEPDVASPLEEAE